MIGWQNIEDGEPDEGDDPNDWDRRVRFLCCDGYENYRSYSPAVYLRCGGGRSAFETVREVAPYLRYKDPNSAAAGLCGFLFGKVGFAGDTGGAMSLHSPPQPSGDGKMEWGAWGGDGDIILIDVRSRSAKCCYGVIAGEEIRDLAIG